MIQQGKEPRGQADWDLNPISPSPNRQDSYPWAFVFLSRNVKNKICDFIRGCPQHTVIIWLSRPV